MPSCYELTSVDEVIAGCESSCNQLLPPVGCTSRIYCEMLGAVIHADDLIGLSSRSFGGRLMIR